MLFVSLALLSITESRMSYAALCAPHTLTAELIDPQEMTTTPISGTFTGESRIKLAGRPYQALRLRRV